MHFENVVASLPLTPQIFSFVSMNKALFILDNRKMLHQETNHQEVIAAAAAAAAIIQPLHIILKIG